MRKIIKRLMCKLFGHFGTVSGYVTGEMCGRCGEETFAHPWKRR